MQQPFWHHIPAHQVLSAQHSDNSGLSAEEVARRLAEHGPNRLTPPKKRGTLTRFLLQFHNVLIYVLLGAAGVTAALGHWVDSGVILGVVLINALIGFVQEGKAEKSLDAIRNMLSLGAAVLRDGRRQQIAAENLVPGDLVLLASGDKVPADLRLVETRSLRIEEAVLTGKSEAVEKCWKRYSGVRPGRGRHEPMHTGGPPSLPPPDLALRRPHPGRHILSESASPAGRAGSAEIRQNIIMNGSTGPSVAVINVKVASATHEPPLARLWERGRG